jgi:hypothetical protein
MTETYICGNCREKQTLEHNNMDAPMCPECKVEQMTEMRRPECGNCDSTTFQLYDPKKARVGSPAPMLECTDCGWTGRVDEDGVWY